jgi:predicted amidohydrolase YtcJ
VDGVETEPDWLELRGVKLFADGGTSSYTAAFHQDYPSRPGHAGKLSYDDAEMEDLIGTAHRAGVQILVHACGDRAQDQVLRAFEKVAAGSPPERPHRMEHLGNTLWDGDRAAWCRRAGVLPAPNCEFIWNYGEFWPGALGADRARKCVPLRSMLDAGFEVPGTADTTGGALVTLSPLHNMWRAVTRKTFRDRVIDPEERISIGEALTMYTRSAAIAGGCGASRGTLEKGKLGDLVMLSTDVDRITPDELEDVRVAHTVVGGQVVFSAPDQP